MTLVLDKDQGLLSDDDEQIGLECPYCSMYAHMSPQSVPDTGDVLTHKPKHVGMVFRCDACDAPVFLRFAVKQFGESQVELYRNFIELERPKERFSFSYLPKETEILFREALSSYSHNNFNAFAGKSYFAGKGVLTTGRVFDQASVDLAAGASFFSRNRAERKL